MVAITCSCNNPIRGGSNTSKMRVAVVYDETLFLLCAESLMRAFLLISEYLARFLFYLDKDKAKSWSDENIHTAKDVTKWLEELRVKYGGEFNENNHD